MRELLRRLKYLEQYCLRMDPEMVKEEIRDLRKLLEGVVTDPAKLEAGGAGPTKRG